MRWWRVVSACRGALLIGVAGCMPSARTNVVHRHCRLGISATQGLTPVVSDEMAFRHDGMAAIARYFYPRNMSPDPKTKASLRSVLTWREPMGSLASVSDVMGRRFRTARPHAVTLILT